MALSLLVFRSSDLSGITGTAGDSLKAYDLRSAGGGTIPEAPRRDGRLSREKGSLGVLGSSFVAWLLLVSIDCLRSASSFNS